MIDSISNKAERTFAKDLLVDEVNLIGDVRYVLTGCRFPVDILLPGTSAFHNARPSIDAAQLGHVNLWALASHVWQNIACPLISDHMTEKYSENIENQWALRGDFGPQAAEAVSLLCQEKSKRFQLVAVALPDQVDNRKIASLIHSGNLYALKQELPFKLMENFRDPRQFINKVEWKELFNPSGLPGFGPNGSALLPTTALQNYVCFTMQSIAKDMTTTIEAFNRWPFEQIVPLRNQWLQKIKKGAFDSFSVYLRHTL